MTTDATKDILTIGELGDLLRVQAWRIRRLINQGKIPEPRRIGRIPIFAREHVPAVERALRDAGYITSQVAADPDTPVEFRPFLGSSSTANVIDYGKEETE